MLYSVRIVVCLVMVFICQKVVGGTATGVLSVTANVGGASNCVLGTVTNMIFSNYSSVDTNPDDATGSLTVTCTANLPYDVGINQGQSAGATEEHRMVTRVGGQQALNYALFQDANHIHNYGTIIGQNTLHQLGTGSAQLITIYGEIPRNQWVETGPYTDVVTLLVTF
jgi:spore coat protein U domain-containing protein, fimbrial subunit CupE1/2/3/6